MTTRSRGEPGKPIVAGVPLTLRVFYCDAQYPDGPPSQRGWTDAQREAAALGDHCIAMRLPDPPYEICPRWNPPVIGPPAAEVGHDGEADSYGGQRLVLLRDDGTVKSYWRCGVCDGYMRDALLKE